MSVRRRDIGHDRARSWLAERIDWPLDEEREAALEAHLEGCAPCRALDAAFRADSVGLRQLAEPVPPRDLPARVLAALDAETGRTRPVPRPAASLRRRGLRRMSSVAFGSLLTIALVMVAGALLVTPGTILPVLPGPNAGATPFAIEPVNLAFVGVQNDTLRIYRAQVDQACPPANTSCTNFAPQTGQEVALPAVTAVSGITLARDGTRAAIAASTASSGGSSTTFYVVDLAIAPLATSSATPTPTATEPAASVPPSPRATPTPTESARPTSTPRRSEAPTSAPGERTASPGSSTTPGPSASEPVASEQPTPAASGEAGASATPISLPIAQPRAILENVIATGASAAWSPDGTTLAFSAMPADGSTGPDIYTWHPGDERAVAITTDHASSFASWAGKRIVGSTTVPGDTDPTQLSPRSFVLDPETGERRSIAAAIWLPTVDATGRYVVAWEGTLVQGTVAGPAEPNQGHLVFAAWKRIDPFAEPEAAPPTPSATPTPERTAAPRESASPSPRPGRSVSRPSASPVSPEPTASPTVAVSMPDITASTPEPLDASPDPTLGSIRDWVVTWSPDGSAFAAWTSSMPGSGIGTLSLYSVDQVTGTLDRNNALLAPTSSSRGFSIAADRLAWASVPDAQGRTQLHVLVWGTYGRGEIRSRDLMQHELLPAF